MVILYGDNSIALLYGVFVYLERDISTVYSIIVFNIGNQSWCILPNEFGFGGNTAVVRQIRVGNTVSRMVDERIQNIRA